MVLGVCLFFLCFYLYIRVQSHSDYAYHDVCSFVCVAVLVLRAFCTVVSSMLWAFSLPICVSVSLYFLFCFSPSSVLSPSLSTGLCVYYRSLSRWCRCLFMLQLFWWFLSLTCFCVHGGLGVPTCIHLPMILCVSLYVRMLSLLWMSIDKRVLAKLLGFWFYSLLSLCVNVCVFLG